MHFAPLSPPPPLLLLLLLLLVVLAIAVSQRPSGLHLRLPPKQPQQPPSSGGGGCCWVAGVGADACADVWACACSGEAGETGCAVGVVRGGTPAPPDDRGLDELLDALDGTFVQSYTPSSLYPSRSKMSQNKWRRYS
jgi:hypothetical protein